MKLPPFPFVQWPGRPAFALPGRVGIGPMWPIDIDLDAPFALALERMPDWLWCGRRPRSTPVLVEAGQPLTAVIRRGHGRRPASGRSRSGGGRPTTARPGGQPVVGTERGSHGEESVLGFAHRLRVLQA